MFSSDYGFDCRKAIKLYFSISFWEFLSQKILNIWMDCHLKRFNSADNQHSRLKIQWIIKIEKSIHTNNRLSERTSVPKFTIYCNKKSMTFSKWLFISFLLLADPNFNAVGSILFVGNWFLFDDYVNQAETMSISYTLCPM